MSDGVGLWQGQEREEVSKRERGESKCLAGNGKIGTFQPEVKRNG